MAEERVQRRLAAIPAADVVGYSRLMGAGEIGTLAALKAHPRNSSNRRPHCQADGRRHADGVTIVQLARSDFTPTAQ